MLKDELVFDRLAGFSLRTKYESLKKDTAEVETHVRQLNECMESLTRLQQRSELFSMYLLSIPQDDSRSLLLTRDVKTQISFDL